MRPRRYLAAAPVALLALTLAVAAFARQTTAPPPPFVGAYALAGPGDSVRVVIHWSPVKDAAGKPPVSYVVLLGTIPGSAAPLAAGMTTTATADTFVVARPAAGDTLRVQASVAARDSRGVLGAAGLSPVLVILGAWTPPPAPVVGVDTLAPGGVSVVPPDSVQIVAVAGSWGRDSTGAIGVTPGDTLELCLLAWRGGASSGAKDPRWQSLDGDVIWPAGMGGAPHCERFATALDAAPSVLKESLLPIPVRSREVAYQGGIRAGR